MRIASSILSFLLIGTILLTCSNEPSPVTPIPSPNRNEKGTISGYLMGDGKLVPHRSYGGFSVELYQNSNFLQADTTNTSGYFAFTDLDTGRYEIRSTADFGYENIAYANDLFILTDTLLEKDLLLDSIRYDFSSIKVGHNYTYLARHICAGIFGTDTLLSQIELTITEAHPLGDAFVYYFTGVQDYASHGTLDCFYTTPDSHYVLNGYFRYYNSQVSCVINGAGGEELAECFRGFHLYDGSDEIKQFLGIGGCDLEIESGILFEVNSQQYETLYMNCYIYLNGTRNETYNFSHQLGLVYSKVWYFMGNHGAGGSEIVLIDFDFN